MNGCDLFNKLSVSTKCNSYNLEVKISYIFFIGELIFNDNLYTTKYRPSVNIKAVNWWIFIVVEVISPYYFNLFFKQ